MKTRRFLAALFALLFVCSVGFEAQAEEGIYTITAKSIDGASVPLKDFKGHILVIVNTASKCGFTPQYRDLQELYGRFSGQGLVVLGFPSNDFGEGDPGSNAEIKKFCTTKFGVTFPMFARNPVTGPNAQPLYRYLTTEAAEDYRGEIGWNFEKILVDRKGNVRARFGSEVNPLSGEVVTKIQELIDEK